MLEYLGSDRAVVESVLWLQFISIPAKIAASKNVLSFLGLVVGIILHQADK